MLHRKMPRFNDTSYAHFITTRTYQNRPYFKNDEFSRMLVEELRFYSGKHGFVPTGWVIMPDHVHLLLWWDKEEKPELSVSKMMQAIKGATSRRIVDLAQARGLERMLQATHGSGPGLTAHRRNLRYRVWQTGFHDFNVHSEEKLLEKLRYMHNNPVKAGLALSPDDYRWSSHREYSEGEH